MTPSPAQRRSLPAFLVLLASMAPYLGSLYVAIARLVRITRAMDQPRVLTALVAPQGPIAHELAHGISVSVYYVRLEHITRI